MQTESVGERDQTEETLRRQNEELAALHETTLGLIQQLDLDTLLHSIVSRATALAGTPHGYLYIVEPGEQTMAVRVGTGIFSEQIGYRLRRGEGLSGRVWETGQPLVVDDYQTWLGRRRDFDPMRLRAVVGIPLFASGGGQVTGDSSARGSEAHPTPNTHHPSPITQRIVGVIGLAYQEEGRKVTAGEVALLDRFARLASLALHNARLYTTAQQEIAERTRAEEALRHNEELYRSLVETSPDAITLTDLSGTVILCNRQAARLYGCDSVEELLGRNGFEFIASEDRLRALASVHETLQAGGFKSIEYTLVRKDGSTFPAELSASVIMGAGGRPRAILGVVRDITERKQAEEEIRSLNRELERRVAERTEQLRAANEELLKEIEEHARAEEERERLLGELAAQHALLETIISSTPVGVGLYDQNMRLVRMNEEFAAVSQQERAAMRHWINQLLVGDGGRVTGDSSGLPITQHPSPITRLHTGPLAGLGGDAIDEDNVRYEYPSGEVRYFDMRYRPVRNASGEVVWVVSTAIDVTARHELDRQKDEFIALASHELRTPLTSIKGFAKMGLRAAMALRDQQLVRMLKVIDEQSDRLARLIDELLDATRIRNEPLPLHPERLDLNQLVHQVVRTQELIAPQFTFTLTLPPTPTIVNADRQRIEEVMGNLIGNAIKYSGKSRRVEVNVRVRGDEAITSVRDYGIGIPAGQQGQVFERYFRAHNVPSSRYGGLGLGLFISHSIVTRHGGRMWLESAEESGSTFYFALPLVAKEEL